MGKNVFGDFAREDVEKVCTRATGNSFLVKKLYEDFHKNQIQLNMKWFY